MKMTLPTLTTPNYLSYHIENHYIISLFLWGGKRGAEMVFCTIKNKGLFYFYPIICPRKKRKFCYVLLIISCLAKKTIFALLMWVKTNNPHQKLWRKPKVSPSPNYQCCSWTSSARNLRATTLKRDFFLFFIFFRIRLSNAKKVFLPKY